MRRFTRTSGNSRVLLRTATAALSTLSFLVCGTSPTTHADDSVEQVHQSGLGPVGPWFRLQDDPSNSGRTPVVRQPRDRAPRTTAPAS
ncbi:hypothetical protein NRF20_19165 [Streptomyces sp. R-74717]